MRRRDVSAFLLLGTLFFALVAVLFGVGLDVSCSDVGKRALFLAAMAIVLGTLVWLADGARRAVVAAGALGALSVAAVTSRDVALWLTDAVIVGGLPAAVVAALIVAARSLRREATVGDIFALIVAVLGWYGAAFGVPAMFVFLAVCQSP